MELKIKKMSGSLAAEVTGVDLSKPLSNDVFQEILSAWHGNLLLIFPEQKITKEEHIEFSRRFGDLEIHPGIIMAYQ